MQQYKDSLFTERNLVAMARLNETMQHTALQVLEKGLISEHEIKINEVKEKCKARLKEVQRELNRILVQQNARQ